MTTVYKVHKRLRGSSEYGVTTKIRPSLEQARLALTGMLREDMTATAVNLAAWYGSTDSQSWYDRADYLTNVLDDFGAALFIAASVTPDWPEVDVTAHVYTYTLEVITDPIAD